MLGLLAIMRGLRRVHLIVCLLAVVRGLRRSRLLALCEAYGARDGCVSRVRQPGASDV